jgi:hypothetical protein
MDLVWLFLANVAVIGVAQWLGATWIKARLESSIAHEYARKLEDYKTTQALTTEIASQRVRVLAEIWGRIADYELKLVRQSRALADVFLNELKRLRVPNVPPALPSSLPGALAVLSAFGNTALDQAATDRVSEAAAETQKVVVEDADTILQTLHAHRFWLGPEIDSELRSYLEELTHAFSNLSPAGEDRAAFAAKYKNLNERRANATNILRRLGLA